MKSSRGRSGVRGLVAIALVALAMSMVSCFGCATTIVPPSLPADSRERSAVYLADYGRHASIILPRSDALLVEYTYGEWQWYAQQRTGFFGAVRSLLIPTQGALGRRHLDAQPGDIWWEDLGFLNLYEIEVERSAVTDLRTRLDARWEAAKDTQHYNAAFDLEFVHDPQVYMFFSNSNPTTARWLRELGCEVRGPALLSKWRLAVR